MSHFLKTGGPKIRWLSGHISKFMNLWSYISHFRDVMWTGFLHLSEERKKNNML